MNTKKKKETTNNPQTTAAAQYEQRRRDLAILLDCIEMELDAHARRAAEDAANWGYAGDLGYITERVRETLQTFLVWRHDVDESVAAEMVDEHLKAINDVNGLSD